MLFERRSRRCAMGTLMAAAFVVGGVLPVRAQTGQSSGADALTVLMETELRRREALQAIQADREGFVEGIVGRWLGLTNDGGRELRNALMDLSDEKLASADQAETLDSLNQTIYNPQALGDPDSDLVFFPLTPCRIIDTRLAGGILVAGVARDFRTEGPFTSQGGDAGDCGLPSSDTAALALTVVAVTPAGPGNVRAWPAGDPLPNAVAINYAPGRNLANTTIVPLKQDAGNMFEFSAQANVSDAHLVADVVGYFWPPSATSLDQTFLTSAATLPPGITGTVTSLACPAGYSVTGGGCAVSDLLMRVIVSGRVNSTWKCAAKNEGGSDAILTAEVICSRIPGR